MSENPTRELLRRMSTTDAPKNITSTPDELRMVLDSLTTRAAPTTFSAPMAWGQSEIPQSTMLFASQREPVVRWLVYWVASDIFDNWFKVVDPENRDSNDLDKAVQKVLTDLNAKQEFIRLFTFERRYGTAVMLLGYTGFDNETWKTPIYETSIGLNSPQAFTGKQSKILQITPYPWSKIEVTKHDEEISSFRFGLPDIYKIGRGTENTTSPEDLARGAVETEVNWSRLIHAATRLDEHRYEGESVVVAVYDDATGFRNMRWGEYETIFRYGAGFPVFTFPWATKEQIQAWIAAGNVSNLNARGYFVAGEEGETVEFIGTKGTALTPGDYNAMALEALSMATRIPKDVLRGASAGTISGSEVNERAKYQMISSEQSLVEPVVRELINRLMDTGQIQYRDKRRGDVSRDYELVWNYPEIVNEKDRATIDFLTERKNTEKLNYMTVNELRLELGMAEVKGGEIVIGIEKQKKVQPFNQERPEPPERRGKEEAEREAAPE